MDEKWFESILEPKFGSTVKVLSIVRGEGLERGENYGSSTARFTLNLQLTAEDGSTSTKELRLFAKFPPLAEAHRVFIDKYDIFGREACVYNEFLPAMAELSKEKGAPEQFRPSYPEVFHAGSCPGEGSAIIMEDLAALGFELGNRKTGLDGKEVELVIRAFARFHAHSYALKEASDSTDEQFKEKYRILGEHDIMSSESIKALFAEQNSAQRTVAAFAKKLMDNSEEAGDKLGSGLTEEERQELVSRLNAYVNQENFPGRIDALLERKGLTCFALGDCWANNMMFRYTEENGRKEPAEIRLLDFQVVRFIPVMFDVGYFWYTSTHPEVFTKLDDYLKIYYEEFFGCLDALGSKLHPDEFTFEDLKEEFCRFEEFGFLLSITGLAFMVISKEDFPEDFGKGFADDFSQLVSNALYGPLGEKVLLRFKDHAIRAWKHGIV